MATLSDIMSSDVVTVKPQTTLRELVGILHEESVSGAPVVSGGRVVGVVSATDLMDFEVKAPYNEYNEPDSGLENSMEPSFDEPSDYFIRSWTGSVDVLERFQQPEEAERDRLLQHTVDQVMTPAIFALSPDEDIRSAAGYMIRRGIHRVLVMENDKLLGIVSALDIVRAVSLGLV